MDQKELAEILKYSHPERLYVVDWRNSLIVLICPFKAIVKDDIGVLKKLEVVFIDEVKVTLELVTVFVVEGKGYFYYHFEILSADN